MRPLKTIVLSIFAALALNYSALAKDQPTNYYNRGMAEFAYNNIPAAIELMNKAIELKPDYADALAYRGYFYNMTNQYDKAISDYVAAEKIKKYVVGYPMACPYALTGKKDEAFKCLEIALSAAEDKANIGSIINDAELTSLHSDPRWNTLISKDWYSAYEKLINEGNKKISEKDLNGALTCWNKAISLEPKKHTAYGSRALTYINQGNLNDALYDLTEAIRLKPTNSTYYGNRAYVYKELGKRTEAMADYDKAIELDPQNMVYGDRAMMKFGINQKDPGVEADLKLYLECFYKDDFNHFLLGTYYDRNGNFKEAIASFDKAITLNNTTPDYFTARGYAYFSDKQYAAAIEDFSTTIKLAPTKGEAYYARGVVYGEQKNKTLACMDWKKAESLGYKDTNGYIKSLCD
jgi:tetratricopeptide (TPR) repeat protein